MRLEMLCGVQQHLEDERVVVVISTRVESLHINGVSIDGVELREQYWIVFQPVDEDTNGACDLLTVGRATLELGDNASALAEWSAGLADYFEGRMSGLLNRIIPALEDAVLAGVLSRSNQVRQ